MNVNPIQKALKGRGKVHGICIRAAYLCVHLLLQGGVHGGVIISLPPEFCLKLLLCFFVKCCCHLMEDERITESEQITVRFHSYIAFWAQTGRPVQQLGYVNFFVQSMQLCEGSLWAFLVRVRSIVLIEIAEYYQNNCIYIFVKF